MQSRETHHIYLLVFVFSFAFVEYEDRKAAEEAMEKYNGFDVEGRRLKIDWDIGLGKKDIKPPRLTGDGHGTAELPQTQAQSTNVQDPQESQAQQYSEDGSAPNVSEAPASHAPVQNETPVDEPLHVEQASNATST